MSGLSTGQSFGLFAASTAVSAISAYSADRHKASMAKISWEHSREQARISTELNNFVLSRQREHIRRSSAEEGIHIQRESLQIAAQARAAQAAHGIAGGSAQAVLHDIARQAENAESARIAERDMQLFSNTVQGAQAAIQTEQQVGIEPISIGTGALRVGAAAAEITERAGTLFE